MLFHHKLRSSTSSSLLFCCFHNGHARAVVYHETASLDCSDGGNPRKVRSVALELPLPEIRYRCRSVIARIGRWRPSHVAVAAAASLECGYDPMSYALNFRDGRSRESDEEFPTRNFSAWLLVSPDWSLLAKLPREVVAYS